MQNDEAYKILVESIAELLKNKSNVPEDMNFVQEEISNLVSSYLFMISSVGPGYEFKVICDETNNSPEDIENKMLNVSIETYGSMTQKLKEMGLF